MNPSTLFIDEATTAHEALSASERFIAYETDRGMVVRVANEDETGPLISMDEVLHLVEQRLEAGLHILMGD